MPPTRRSPQRCCIVMAKGLHRSTRASIPSRKRAAPSGRMLNCPGDEWWCNAPLVPLILSVSKSAQQNEGGSFMRTTRRRFVQGTLATTALSGIPNIVSAQPSRAKTIRAVMQGDLRSLDPIWTTANITAYHGAMIYDTLFALDEQMRPQPQMVSKWGLSDDKLTYTFELRDGLKFHDGSALTADDVVASIRRWAARTTLSTYTDVHSAQPIRPRRSRRSAGSFMW